MPKFIDTIGRCLRLAAPFDRRGLVVAVVLIVCAGIAQMLSVVSILPFLNLASNPESIDRLPLDRLGLSSLRTVSRETLLTYAGLTSILAIVLTNLTVMASDFFRLRYAYGFGGFVRTCYIKSIAKQPYSFFLEHNSGRLLQRLNETNEFITYVFVPSLDIVSRLLAIILLTMVIVTVNPVAFAGALLIGTLYVFVFTILRRYQHRFGQILMEANRDALASAQELLTGIKPITSMDKLDFFVQDYDRHVKLAARQHPRAQFLARVPRQLLEPLVFSSIIGFLIFVAAKNEQAFANVLPSMTVVAFAIYRMMPLIQIVFSNISFMTTYEYTVSGIEEFVRDIQNSQTETQATPLEFDQSISLQGISFQYPGQERPTLEDISLDIERNTTVGIVGTTGSGKSTLVDLILGLHQPTTGQILVDDVILDADNIASLRRKIGYIPQGIFLRDASITSNIAFGVPNAKIDVNRVRESARLAKLLDFIEQELPQGFDTKVGERGVRLSGGQVQRIGIARALYYDPELLIFDEATSALDQDTESAIVESIRTLAGNKTMLIIAHRTSTLRYCDRILRLDHGVLQPEDDIDLSSS